MSYPTAGKILVVDDQIENINLLGRLMTRRGYEVVSASGGVQALAAVGTERPDIILLDVNMPEIDGFEVCRCVKADPVTRLIPVILITGLTQTEDRVRGIESGADDFLSKPFEPSELEARVRSLTKLKRYTDELESAESVILALASTIEARDPFTGDHCERLARYARAFGSHLGLDHEQCTALYRGGYLHDIGKVAIPDAVLLKPGPLTPQEYARMQQHTVIGDSLCGEFRSFHHVRHIVRHHHERVDGSGYPDGLSGESIPLLAHVISIVDAYDAMTNDRAYRTALSTEAACGQLRLEVEKGWKRAELVKEFVGLVENGAFARRH